MVVMESDERLNEKRLKRRTELRLRILAARHKKLQLQKWKITEKLPIEQKLKAADLKSFGIYYEKVFKKGKSNCLKCIVDYPKLVNLTKNL